MIWQTEITLPQLGKGLHIIDHIIEEATLENLPEKGIMHLFLKHTSAALMINENADPDVRTDLETLYNKMAPEGASFYTHTLEGEDDMPAHFKSGITGVSLTIPISGHKFNLGTWQGIYYCEFRNFSGPRRLVITIYGE